MNRLLELIGRNIGIIGIFMLSGFVATAGVMYFGLPAKARAKVSAPAADDCSACPQHAAPKPKASCCPPEGAITDAAMQPPAGCPASGSAATAAHTGTHEH